MDLERDTVAAGPRRDSHMDAVQDIRHALKGLREAVAQRRVEPICLAYQLLREAAQDANMKLSDMLKLADQALPGPAADTILSAFARRRCFMCKSGTVQCEECSGTGIDERSQQCRDCNGAGVTSCDFCGGTGWAGRGTMPREIPSDTLRKRRLANVKRQLIGLRKTMGKLGTGKAAQLPLNMRRKLALRVMRLQARLRSLARETPVGNDTREHLLAAASKLDPYLAALRWPPGEQPGIWRETSSQEASERSRSKETPG